MRAAQVAEPNLHGKTPNGAAQVAKHMLHGSTPQWFLGQGAEVGSAAKKEGYRRVLRRQKANRRNTEDQWLKCHRRCPRCPDCPDLSFPRAVSLQKCMPRASL